MGLSAPELIVTSVRLTAELARVIERSKDLLWLSRQRRQDAPARAPRIVGGSDDDGRIIRDRVAKRGGEPSDDGLVATAIMRATLCPECISAKTGVPATRVQTVLGTLAKTFTLTIAVAPCDACLLVAEVFRLI